jgi:arginase
MISVAVPYHLDEYLPDLDLPAAVEVTVAAPLTAATTWSRLTQLYGSVAGTVADIAGRGGRPAVYSGDCATAMGTVAGLQRAGIDPAIVWFDAHGDVQTMETTASGYLGGMPLRVLTGYRRDLIAGPLGLRPVLERDILLVDARDLDPPELVYLESAAIRRCDVHQVAAELIPRRPIYLHLDLDVLDPGDAPGLRFPAPGGPALPDLVRALREVIDTGRVVALGVACTWHPGHPGAGAAAALRPHLDALLTGWR